MHRSQEMIDNKYRKIYNTLINNAIAQSREKTDDIVYEKHHITPRALGGDNSSTNLVFLTPKEHYICHHLLTKFTTGAAKHKMMLAYKMMLRSSKSNVRNFVITARMYDRAKRFQSEVSKHRVHPEAVKAKISQSLQEWHSDPSNKEKFVEARRNQNITQEHRDNWATKSRQFWDSLTLDEREAVSATRAGSRNGMYGKKRTKEEKDAVSRANKGNQYAKGFKQPVRKCPHCGKEGGNAMLRWHFDNCKLNV